MSIQAFMSLTFTVETAEEADAIVAGLTGLPAGASVNTMISEQRTDSSGNVDEDGNIVPIVPPPDDWGFTLTSLDPSSAPAGTAQITARGTGFVNGAYLVIGDARALATYVSAEEANADIDLSGLDPGDHVARMEQAGISTDPPLTFTVEAP